MPHWLLRRFKQILRFTMAREMLLDKATKLPKENKEISLCTLNIEELTIK